MTLLNMKNVIYISSLNKLIVGSNAEHAILYTCWALITSISTHFYMSLTKKKRREQCNIHYKYTQDSIDLLHLHVRLFEFIFSTSQLIRFRSSFINIRITLSICKSIKTISVVCLLH
jgi:homoserine trans-succinylase